MSLKQQSTYILVALFLAALTCSAQKVPGYLGKRFSIEYNAFVFPSFHNPNSEKFTPKSENNLRLKGTSINIQHNIIAQWCISKKSSIVGSFGYANTNFIPVMEIDNHVHMDEYPSMYALSYEVGLRYFVQHIAPLSDFVEFRFGVISVTNNDFSFIEVNHFSPNINHTVSGNTRLRPAFAMAIGSNRIIRDKIIISYGLDFKLYTGGFGRYVNTFSNYPGDFQFYDENGAGNQRELWKMAAGRYAMHAATNLRLGVGWIL